jgi:anaerobic magnesium-protoporphyrin IX monomethyl ester cyclase
MPPLGIMYLSAVLKRGGHEVEVIDLVDKPDIEEFMDIVYGGVPDADIHGISCVTPTFPFATRILQKIREKNNTKRVVIGGPHASIMPDACLDAGFDQVIVGEGERAIVKIADGDSSKILKEPFVKDLDDIPFPDRECINIKSYKYEIDGVESTTALTSRGCYYNKCVYCESKELWGKLRLRSAENVISEIRDINRRYGYRGVMFYDDEMLYDWRRDRKVVFELDRLGMVWRCFSRANLLTEKRVKVIAKKGCKEVLIGVESGSDRILRNVRKGTTVEMNRQAIELLKKYGIRAKAAIIVGLPGENEESLLETEYFLDETMPDDVDVSLLKVYPRADIYENPDKYDLKFDFDPEKSWFKGVPGEYCSTVSTSSLSADELLRWRDRLEAKFKKGG